MKIETKYNVGDIVHFMKDNKTEYAEVININITVEQEYCSGYRASKPFIEYSISEDKKNLESYTKIFPTKQDLLNSL